MSPEAVEAARGKLFVEYPLFVPPPIANANLDALRKRYESVGVPIGPEASEVLLEGTDAEIAALLTPEQRYVRERGWTPLEFLHAVYKQPFCPLNARLRAAEKLMEYLHRPLPRAFVGVEGQPGLLGSAHDLVPIGGLGQFDPKRLSAAELTSLDALMRKGCGEAQPVSNAIKGKK